ncbi:MAG: non-canonical purine NTP pyrophosphatase, RdgB/HAM1 family [Legionellales bacterium RIFCSPHIGHO2_12_FULL_37_14]|nr:MAG: non-canonical purine NTP pyrophosphatase, RdgB/HAM1 family [Legionellales bacterium RIFCSPHIGHO2_12_FULL_37_14]
MQSLILATTNQGKINELTALLKPITCIPQQALNIKEIEESGLTFVENALLKARHASKIGKLPALADDSGLVVAALNGEPGIYSARFAAINGSKLSNMDYLLKRLTKTKPADRTAYFYCALALVQHESDPMPLVITAKWCGIITQEKQGNLGFGYDPIFYLPSLGLTAAQLSLNKKNTLSHRGQALQILIASLKDYGQK